MEQEEKQGEGQRTDNTGTRRKLRTTILRRDKIFGEQLKIEKTKPEDSNWKSEVKSISRGRKKKTGSREGSKQRFKPL